MDNNQLIAYTRLLVTDLVATIATQDGPDWVLNLDAGGLIAGTHFKNREELIERVAQAFVARYGAKAGIRAA